MTQTMTMRRPLFWLAVMGMVGLVACGGGGGSGGSRTQPPPNLGAVTVSPAAPWVNGATRFETSCAGTGTLSYEWDMGDGSAPKPTTEARIAYVYLAGGPRDVSVACIDSTGQRSSIRTRITVDAIDLTIVADRTCSSVLPGHGWCVQNPLPTAVGLNDIAVVERATLWAVGQVGSILKSSDAGVSWKPQHAGTLEPLTSIAARSASLAWAVGGAGSVLKTTNGGDSWQLGTLAGAGTLRKVIALDADTVWVAGDSGVRKSTDGGATWVVQNVGATSWASMSAPSERVGWVAGSNGVRRTLDGGGAWSPVAAPAGESWRAVAAVSADVAWLLSDNGIWRTDDGGRNWALQRSISVEGYTWSLVALDARTAWAAGATFDGEAPRAGIVWKTSDAGAHWDERRALAPLGLTGLSAESADRAWAVGRGAIVNTLDGGLTWNSHTSGSTPSMVSMAAANDRTAWVVGGNGSVFKTVDGGVVWAPLPSVGLSGARAIAAADAGNVWAVGPAGTIVNSSNGGANWFAVSSGTLSQFNAVSVAGASTAWAVGDSMTVWHTGPNGTLLQTLPATTPTSVLTHVAAIDGNSAWVSLSVPSGGSTAGSLLYTSNGGQTWQHQLDSATHMFQKVVAVNASTAWALGQTRNFPFDQFTVFRTTNGGTTWLPVWTLDDSSVDLLALSAQSASRAQVAGTKGLVYLTQDGGTTWVSQDSGSPQATLSAMVWLGPDTAWAVGSDGLILKTLTGGR